jgi:hypothetical protein
VLRLIALLIVVTVAVRSAQADAIAVKGVGTNTCAEFGEFYKQSPGYWEIHFFTWAQGFMSGMNLMLAQKGQPATDLEKTSLESQQMQIRTYCDKHPLVSYMKAVIAVWADMRVEQGLPDPRN